MNKERDILYWTFVQLCFKRNGQKLKSKRYGDVHYKKIARCVNAIKSGQIHKLKVQQLYNAIPSSKYVS